MKESKAEAKIPKKLTALRSKQPRSRQVTKGHKGIIMALGRRAPCVRDVVLHPAFVSLGCPEMFVRPCVVGAWWCLLLCCCLGSDDDDDETLLWLRKNCG
jgi:hypothetical protein